MLGRDQELAQLLDAVGQAERGRGGVWLVAGSAGLGKSTLLAALADTLADRGACRSVWAHAWEAGGAPPLWPWTQVVRGLVASLPDAQTDSTEALRQALPHHSQWLGAVVPELPTAGPADTDPAEARFRVFDAVAQLARRAARDGVIVLLLEDVHAWDEASISLLDFLRRQLVGASIMVVGTYRAGASPATVGPIVAAAQRIDLRPLGRGLVADTFDWDPSKDTDAIDTVMQLTGGHPLYVVELARLVRAQPGLSRRNPRSWPLPDSVRATIEARLARLTPATRELLERVAVMGPTGRAELDDEALDEVRQASLLAVNNDRWGFQHALVRDAVYAMLPLPRRQALHAVAAESAATVEARAHHLRRAGDDQAKHAREAASVAGDEALERYAFEAACDHYAYALREAGSGDAHHLLRRRYVRALLHAGRPEVANALCLEQVGRETDGVRVAELALELGSVFVFTTTDVVLVQLLQRALELLPTEPSPHRARAQARLAAALQPASPPEGPIAMATEAIGMARTLGDDATLLDCLVTGVATMMDLERVAIRRPLNQETFELAQRLRRPGASWRASLRLAVDALESGAPRAAVAHVDTARRLSETLGHPRYRWPVHGLQAGLAVLRGDVETARSERREARRLAAEITDANSGPALAAQACGEAALTNEGTDEALAVLRASVRPGSFFAELARVFEGLIRARWSNQPPALPAALLESAVTGSDVTMLGVGGEIAASLGDLSWAQRFYDALLGRADDHVSWGMSCLFADGPVRRVLGLLARALGRHAEAKAHFQAALREAEQAGLVLHAALIRRQAAAASTALVTAPPTSATAVRDGDAWCVSYRGTSVRIKDSKGMRILAQLLETPGRAHRALVLDGGRPDEGAGETLIDEEAAIAYRQHLSRIDDALDKAVARGDLGRRERLSAEREALVAELARATGLSGQPRRNDAAQKARINVQRRIKHALKGIGEHHPACADHLARAVTTGQRCVYDP